MFTYPSEHQPHKATRMAFGAHPRIWSAKLATGVCRDQADIARAIARFEPVNLLVTKENRAVAQQSLTLTVRWMISGCATVVPILFMIP